MASPLRRNCLVWTLLVLVSTLLNNTSASECAACGYLARNCSHTKASDSVNVCTALGHIQIDDVFCDDDECQCADRHACVSTVVGCSNLFQSRNRRRCVSNATLARRFTQCAFDQGLTTLEHSNVASDWIYYRQSRKCQSIDCLAVQMFHHSRLSQCGHLLAVWKTNASTNTVDEDVVMYHFIADGSRGSDLKAGTFLYSVPWVSDSLVLQSKGATTRQIETCYVLQTRNEPNGTCEGMYVQFDARVQFAHSDTYVISKLSWPVWCVVVGSVVAAMASVASVGLVIYRSQQQRSTLTPSVDANLSLRKLIYPQQSVPMESVALGLPTTASERRLVTDLRQRGAPFPDVEVGKSKILLKHQKEL
ncbi:hypothetical protein CCR75_001348 [Bremia lactucae]|uniref:Secreted protein n=1 Tax=Bremia lactucae TaxID=4779 RepID=A0A976FF59_BRELC|nr:hypothetical protein CCR75_001348 [Bremia lactucae]